MKALSKILTVLLGVILIIPSMAACQGKKDRIDFEFSADGVVPYEKPLDIKVYFQEDGATNFAKGEDYGNNIWIDAYKKFLNINIISAGVVTSEEYNSKMSMLLSANSLPDIFYLDAANLAGYSADGQLADLKPYYESTASELVKSYMAYDNGVAWNRFGGYGVPKLSTLYDDSVGNIAIRTDWLENIGYSEPKTWDDILKIIEAFATKDPDGNGKNDTWGMAIDNQAVDGILRGVADLQGFFNAYHAYPGRWIPDGKGGITYGSIQDTMIKPLSVLADFYKKGYIDPAYDKKDRWTVQSDIQAGKIGLAFQAFWAPSVWANLSETLGDKLKFYPIMSADEQPMEFYFKDWWAQGGMVVNKKFSNPEAIFKMMNLEMALGNDTSGIWTKMFQSDEGYTKHKYMIVSQQPAPDYYIKAYQAYLKGYENNLAPGQMEERYQLGYSRTLEFMEGNDNQLRGWSGYMTMGPKNSTYSVLKHYMDNNMIKMDLFTGMPTKTMWSKSSTMQWEEIGSLNAIIMNKQPIDYFSKFIENWNTKGGKKVLAEVQEWYASSIK